MKCSVTFRACVGLLWWSVLLYLSRAAAEWYMLLLSVPAVRSISCHHLRRTTAANYFSMGRHYYSKAAASCFHVLFLESTYCTAEAAVFILSVLYCTLSQRAGRVLSNSSLLSLFLQNKIIWLHFLSLPLLKWVSFSWCGANVLASICTAWC